jgi:hypothetical protein
MIDDLSAAMHDLSGGHIDQDPIDKNPYLANPTLEKIHTASDYLQDWSGRAAMQFKQKFLDPFPAISANAHATMDAFDNKCCDKSRRAAGRLRCRSSTR